MIFLSTERLQLKKVSKEDAPFFFELLNTPSWLKYIGDRGVVSVEVAESYIQKNYLPSFEKYGYGTFVVQLKETGKPIGSCGLYKRDNVEHPDIGFAFLEEYKGKGYGFEASKALLKVAFKDFNIPTILGFTTKTNTASIQLLKKLGLKKNGTYRFEDDPEELLLFKTDKIEQFS